MGGIVSSMLSAAPAKGRRARDVMPETLHELVNSEHCLNACDTKADRPVLKSGPLLKWIDISATFAGMRHLRLAGTSGFVVTRSMDTIDFLGSAFLGDILELKSKVVSVGRTSILIEVEVTATDSQTQNSHIIAVANVTMVRVGWGLTGFGPQPVPPLVSADQKRSAPKPRKIEEKFSPDLWEEFLRESKGVTRTGMDPAATRTQCLKFVFPEHLNPGGYTFGGNILSWMHDSAYLCGSKFAKQRLLLSASINKVSFLVPSTNTDVLVFSCQVNRVFNSSFVVGCRVEKVDQTDPENLIHICSGQFTMVTSDPSKLRQIFPRTEEDQRRFYRASVRRAGRLKMEE